MRGCLRNKSDRVWFFSSILVFLHYWNSVGMNFLNFFECFIIRFLWKCFLRYCSVLSFCENGMSGKIVVLELWTRKASFQRLLKFRTWFCLPCTVHFNMICKLPTVKKLVSMLLLTIRKCFTNCICRKLLGLNQCIKGLFLVMYCTGSMILQSPDSCLVFWSSFLLSC